MKLRANVPALAAALGCEEAAAAVAAELRGYAYACEFAQQSAEFAQIAAAKSHFGELFERERVPAAAAGCAQEAAVLVLACELEAVAGFKIVCAKSASHHAQQSRADFRGCEQKPSEDRTSGSSSEVFAKLPEKQPREQAVGEISPEISDLFFRIWATSVSEIQPALRAIIAPGAGSLEDLVGGVIKQIINKE